MKIKRVMLASLCALMLATGMSAWAQGASHRVLRAKTRKHSTRARLKKPATPQVIQAIAPLKDEFTDRLTIKGEIISVDAGNFTVRDARGMDTVVFLFPGTAYQIAASSGALQNGEAKMIFRSLIVEVEGLLNSSYQMKATVIRTTEADLKAARALQAIMGRH